jgi:hypothetical protein
MKVLANISKNAIFILGILSVLVLSGCAGGPKYAKHKVNLEEFQMGNKAIVITKAHGKDKNIFGRTTESSAAISLARVDSNYPEVMKRLRYRNNTTGFRKYDIFMIEPGDYALEEIVYHNGNIMRYTTTDGYLPDQKQYIFAQFSVKPNDIIYLGDIVVDHANVRKHLALYDSHEKAQEYFNKKYPALAGKLVRKHLAVKDNPYPVSMFSEKVTQTNTVYMPVMH